MTAGWGVILLHGKWDTPRGAVLPLAEALERNGAVVRSPLCSWSPRRLYDCSFEQALDEIAGHIVALQASGYRHLLLAGHSLGANAALAAASRHAGVDALALIAPGHLPDRLFEAGATREAMVRATAATPGGRLRLPDFNQGQCRLLRFEPGIWHSFYDPAGAALMPRSAATLAPPRPVLWLAPRTDPLASEGRGYAFDLLPPHPQNSWVELEGEHAEAPLRSIPHLLDWLHSLDTRP